MPGPAALLLAPTPAIPLVLTLGLMMRKVKVGRDRTHGLRHVLQVAHIRHGRGTVVTGTGSPRVIVSGFTQAIGLGLAGLFGLSALMLVFASRRPPAPTAEDIAKTPEWSDADFTTLAAAAKRLRMNPADLLLVLASESGLHPWAKNPSDSSAPVAVGLNQLTSVANSSAGISEAQRLALPSKSVAEQLPIVEHYFASVPWTRAGRPYPHAGVVYEANFAGGKMMTVGTAPDAVLYTEAADPGAYNGNRGLDTAGKGYITVGDLIEQMRRVSGRDVYQAGLARLRYAMGDARVSPGLPR